ncbi:hypothetical protein LZ30DRAFT_786675 [Colletotrichum cereale]|nr:hypothetical protein LZ30DRAFT_786675 [Colletotrichum cereale]
MDRAAGLLPSLDDGQYAVLCLFLCEMPGMAFPTPYRMKRSGVQVVVHALHHVIAWIDTGSAAGIHARVVSPDAEALTELKRTMKRSVAAYMWYRHLDTYPMAGMVQNSDKDASSPDSLQAMTE